MPGATVQITESRNGPAVSNNNNRRGSTARVNHTSPYRVFGKETNGSAPCIRITIIMIGPLGRLDNLSASSGS